MSVSTLLYYFNTLSQPCRTLKILLDINKIPYIPKIVNLAQGEHFQEEFKKLNPLKKVPVIEHDHYILTESIAIARYLCRETNISEHWYPKDSKKQASVDEFLEWHHIGLRTPCAMYFQYKISKLEKINGRGCPISLSGARYLDKYDIWNSFYDKTDAETLMGTGSFIVCDKVADDKVLYTTFDASNKYLRPLISGKPPNEKNVKMMYDLMLEACSNMENVWLKDKKFICGDNITIADLFGACELEQPRMAGYDPREGRPILKAWMERVEKETKPYYTDAHEYLNKIVKKYNGQLPTSISKL